MTMSESEYRARGPNWGTYAEYVARDLEGKREHYAKYEALAQCFSLAHIKALVPATADEIRAALDAGDEHLNTIPLPAWDSKHYYFKTIPRAAYNITNGNWALCETVCLLKHVARHHIAGVPAP
jgi:hypothetical protein